MSHKTRQPSHNIIQQICRVRLILDELKKSRVRFNKRMLKDMIKIIERERGLSKEPLDANNMYVSSRRI